MAYQYRKPTEEEIKEIKAKKALEQEKKAKEAEAKKEQKEKEKKEAQERKAKMAFNRQINYFIMRYMWQAIRGRSAEESIYLALNMSRERYTRIIETGKVWYGKNELDFLAEKTGIPQAIFTGEERFTCPDKQGNNSISEAEWKNLFSLRETRKDERSIVSAQKLKNGILKDIDKVNYNQASANYKTAQEAIEKKLREAPRKGEASFQKLCSFLKNGYGSRLETLQGIGISLSHVTVTLLDECSKKELEQLYRLLAQKAKLVNVVLLYRGAKGDFKK